MRNEVLKHWAEDAAWQFKVLHKTADLYHYLYRCSTIVVLLIAVLALAWEPSGNAGKLCGALALLLSVVLLVYQQDIEKVRDYRKHADRYKNVYDSLERANAEENPSLDAIEKVITDLRELNAEFPLSKPAHWWTKKVINTEMNLDWLKQ